MKPQTWSRPALPTLFFSQLFELAAPGGGGLVHAFSFPCGRYRCAFLPTFFFRSFASPSAAGGGFCFLWHCPSRSPLHSPMPILTVHQTSACLAAEAGYGPGTMAMAPVVSDFSPSSCPSPTQASDSIEAGVGARSRSQAFFKKKRRKKKNSINQVFMGGGQPFSFQMNNPGAGLAGHEASDRGATSFK